VRAVDPRDIENGAEARYRCEPADRILRLQPAVFDGSMRREDSPLRSAEPLDVSGPAIQLVPLEQALACRASASDGAEAIVLSEWRAPPADLTGC
jgi:hypothetical protein